MQYDILYILKYLKQLYKEQLTQLSFELQHKRPEYPKRHEKVIFQHDNTRQQVAKLVKETLATLG